MGLDERVTPIRQHPKSDETTSKAHLKPGWMGILPAVTIVPAGVPGVNRHGWQNPHPNGF